MTQASIEPTEPAGNRLLWVGLLSGPIIYSLHFLVVYFLVETACHTDQLRGAILGWNLISFWVLIITVSAALITAVSALFAWRQWRRLFGAQLVRLELSQPLLTFLGVWLNLFFTLLIVLTGLPALFLVVCDWI